MRKLILLYIFTLVSLFGYTRGIYAGQIVQLIKQYPYQVSVYEDGNHVCGGVIFDTSTILTAAHCIERNVSKVYTIRAGSPDHSNAKEYIVIHNIVHNDFNKTAINDLDIAILKLSTNLPLDSTNIFQRIPLQEQYNDVPPTHKTICKVSGWGQTVLGSMPTLLRAAEVSILSNEECSRYYRDYFSQVTINLKMTRNMLCARALKCPARGNRIPLLNKGDSGGPLVCGGKLVGIFSFGPDYNNRNWPGFYTKISELHDWINENNQPNYCLVNKKTPKTNKDKNNINPFSFLYKILIAIEETILNYYTHKFSDLK